MKFFKKSICLTATFFIFGCSASFAAQGAFGVSMGSKPSDFGCTAMEDSPTFFICDKLPQTHPDMESYIVQSGVSSGVCFVKAIGKDISENSFGSNVKRKVDDISEQISTRYGISEKTDFLMSGSIWDDADDWIMGVLKGERFYGFKWSGEKISGHLESVYLAAKAVDSSTSYPVVEFYFKNQADCDRERKNVGSGAF